MTETSRITRIKFLAPKGRSRAEQCRVEVDGETWAVLEAEIVVREGLRSGEALGAARREALLLADETLRAHRAAVRRSALKMRSEAELRRRLREKGFGQPAIDAALAKMIRAGAVDDAEVAGRFVRRRLREGGHGTSRMRSEMRGLGLDSKIIDRALATELADTDLFELCLAFARRKASRYQPLGEPSNRKRMFALLQRRGFDSESVDRALSTISSEGGGASNED